MTSSIALKKASPWLGALSGLALAGVLLVGSHRPSRNLAQPNESPLKASVSRLPLKFEENRGQTDSRVKFISRGPGYSFYLTGTDSVMAMARMPEKAKHGELPGRVPVSVLRMHLSGSNPKPKVAHEGKLAGYSNYFIGQDKSKWHPKVPAYGRIRYSQVYPGVDLVYYGNQRNLEHDFVLKAGVDPAAIKLDYSGARKVSINKQGDLQLETEAGVVTQNKPVAYQTVDGKRREVPARYAMLPSREVGFQVDGYDRARPLVIDPVLRYSTYVGGSADDYAIAMTIDANKNVYYTGYTGSFDQADNGEPNVQHALALAGYPTVNPLMGDPDRASAPVDINTTETTLTTFNGSRYDAVVTKVNPDGTGLVYSTYLGSGADDYGLGIAVDAATNMYITGMTRGNSWPLQVALQTYQGGDDAFVVKLPPDGSRLIYSTYIGGSGNDRGRAIAVDGTGNVHIAGITNSINFPVFSTDGFPFQPTFGGGSNDAFLISLDASGSAFNYSTFFGGTGDEDGLSGSLSATALTYTGVNTPFNNANIFGGFSQPMGADATIALAVDTKGNAYVTGGTSSTDFYTSPGAFQPAKSGGVDAYVAKFGPDGNVIFSTFLGGQADDAGRAIAIDANGNPAVTGYTLSNNFPTQIPDAAPAPGFQSSIGGGADAFVTKLDKGGQKLVFSTFLGGNGEDIGNGIAISAGGQVYVTGSTTSDYPTFPLVNPFQSRRVGSRDVFMTKFRPDGSDYEYSTYFGGSNGDRGMSIVVDQSGQAYVCGITESFDLPTTLFAFQRSNRSDYFNLGFGTDRYNSNPNTYPQADCFVVQPHAPPFAASNLTLTRIDKTSADLAWQDNSDNEFGFDVERKLGDFTSPNPFAVVSTINTPNTVTFSDTGLISATTYTYRVRPFNKATVNGVLTTFYGPYSNQLTVTTFPDPPADPTTLTVASIDTGRLKVSWADNANNEKEYHLERKLGPANSTNAFAEIVILAADTTTYTDTGLASNTTYSYRIRAFNIGGFSNYSNIGTGTTLPDPPNTVKPGLSAAAISNTEIDLTITYAPLDATGFKVYRSPDGVTYSLYRVTTTPSLTFKDTGLVGKTTFYYKVQPYNVSGDGLISDPASATTLPDPPADPTNLTAQLLAGPQAKLTWKDNSTDETDFRVERSTDGGQTFTEIQKINSPGIPNTTGTVTYTDATIQNDSSYIYRVRAAALGSFSAYTNTAQVDTPPAAPSSLAVHATGSTRVRVSFTDNSKAETGFDVVRSVDGGAFNPLNANLGPSAGQGATVTFTDTGVTAEHNYAYKVAATNSAGTSAQTGPQSATTLAAPTSLQLNPVSQTILAGQFTDNSNFESNFRVERSSDGGNTWTTIQAALPASAGTGGFVGFVDTGLTAATTYKYRAQAYTAAADSDYVTADGTTLPNPPAAPSNVTVTPLSQTSLSVSFTDNADNEDGFTVEMGTALAGPFSAVTSMSPANPVPAKAGTGGIITVTVNGLTANTTYYFRVLAFNTGGNSPYSGVGSGTTLPNPPAAPSGLSATLTGPTTIHLSFTDNANNETGFEIYRSTNGGSTFNLLTTISSASAGTGAVVNYDDSNLLTDTTYTYEVEAFNTGGDSSPSATASALTAPAAPSNLRLTSVTNSSIRLFWANNSNTVTSFKVERQAGGAGPFVQIGTTNGTTFSYPDSGLSGATLYTYRLRASNGTNFDSDYSPTASATTLPDPPAAPSNLTLSVVSQTQITVSFRDNASNETGFLIERSPDGNTFTALPINQSSSTGTGGTVTINDSGLTANKPYWYRVSAFNAGGSSATVTAGPATTLPNPPAQPTNLIATPLSATEVSLSFQDNADNETGFVLERSTNGTTFTQAGGTIGASAGTNGVVVTTDTGLSGNTKYTYRVRAVNAGGQSTSSSTATALTLPSAPTGTTATLAAGGASIKIEWTASDGGADSYQVEVKTDQPNDSTFRKIAEVPGSQKSATYGLLIPNVKFTFRVRAVNKSGVSDPSSEASVTTPTGIVSVTLSPSKTKGGTAIKPKSVTGTVNLGSPAPAGGITVSISSSNSGVASIVNKTVTVPAGSTSATFKVNALKVKKTTEVTITASAGGSTQTTTLTVTK